MEARGKVKVNNCHQGLQVGSSGCVESATRLAVAGGGITVNSAFTTVGGTLVAVDRTKEPAESATTAAADAALLSSEAAAVERASVKDRTKGMTGGCSGGDGWLREGLLLARREVW